MRPCRMRSTWLAACLLVAVPASADVAGAPRAVEPDCPPGSVLEGPYRYWYCALDACGAGDACRSGHTCQTVRVAIDGDRVTACAGADCVERRACVRDPNAAPDPLADIFGEGSVAAPAPAPATPAPDPPRATSDKAIGASAPAGGGCRVSPRSRPSGSFAWLLFPGLVTVGVRVSRSLARP